MKIYKAQAEVFNSEVTASGLMAQITREVTSLSFEIWGVFFLKVIFGWGFS